VEKETRGTEVTLHLREGEDDFLSGSRLRSIIGKYSDHIVLPVVMKKEEWDKDKSEYVIKDEDETVNQANALWARPKADITQEQYDEFYKHVAHDFEAPLCHSHARVEGSKEYTLLLYVPKKAPFDLFDREHRHGIKLYVRRVFIMDDCRELIPEYLNFIKGVVDSEDLPLNISREMLQNNPQVAAIRKAVLDLATNDPETFNKIYEGKAKILYEGPEPGTIIQYFKDDATAFNALKKGTINGKGVINNRISEYVFTRLNHIGIPTHFIRRLNMREQLVREVEIIPIEVVIRNIAAGSLTKRFGIPEGTQLPRSIVEYYYKNDQLSDPMVSEEHITGFGWAAIHEIDEMLNMSLRINDFLTGMFLGIGIRLVDFKVEFGRLFHENGDVQVVLADELSPDNMRLWDVKTNEKMDKDRFRRDMGGLVEAYQEVAKRLGILGENEPIGGSSPKLVQ